MLGAPRIIPRTELWPSMRHEPAADPRLECSATIKLQGRRYRCGRQHVDGIHDAFTEHGDGGAVRW
jgi:hypothetical protein